jgi:hypothetical protein
MYVLLNSEVENGKNGDDALEVGLSRCGRQRASGRNECFLGVIDNVSCHNKIYGIVQ